MATGALPTAITVASANLVDLTVDTADLKDGAVTSAKVLNGSLLTTDFDTTTAVSSGGVPVITVSTSAASGGKNGDVWIVV